MLLQYAFLDCTEGIYILTRIDSKHYNIARLQARTNLREVLICEMMIADETALMSHAEEGLQELLAAWLKPAGSSALTSALKRQASWHKTTPVPKTLPSTARPRDGRIIQSPTVDHPQVPFSRYQDKHQNKSKAAAVMVKLTNLVRNNNQLKVNTKLQIC